MPMLVDNNKRTVPNEMMKPWNQAYEYLNKFLEDKKWLVGDSYTLADFSFLASATSSIILINMDEYPNAKAWMKRCEEELPGYNECNVPGLEQLYTA